LSTNSRIQESQIVQLQHLGKINNTDFLNYAQTTNPEAEQTIKDAHIKAEEKIIKFIVIIVYLGSKICLLVRPKPCCC
jgi:hypothetical protein